MPDRLRIAYFAHSIRSDWNNGNAHFLRGLLSALVSLGHDVTTFEPERGWSFDNLLQEPEGEQSLCGFATAYAHLDPLLYGDDDPDEVWRDRLVSQDAVILHEWNPPGLAALLLRLRDQLGFRLLFHDTHHRASSSPAQIEQFGLTSFDGVLAFGDALRLIYLERYRLKRVWTLHEAADTAVFKPLHEVRKDQDVVWVGNWGDGERSQEISQFLLEPAAALKAEARTRVFGVRYPEEGLQALRASGVDFGGYLPNLEAPAVYSRSRLTVHIPRQHYNGAMRGIPTIRVFEALACGVPLLSAPWQDDEQLFRPGDLTLVEDGSAMLAAMKQLLREPELAADQAARGLETVLSRHTCRHRAEELTGIIEELRA